MTASTLSENKPNRRFAARIYQQANLFYRKIDNGGSTQIPATYSDLLEEHAAPQSLPVSQSLENDTLKVNISASGIAFTCQEQVQAGDLLMLRILLLPRMTTIMTSCRVVYCIASNPYETDRYPYTVGAEFVNMTIDDRELLSTHIRQTRKQQWLLNGSLLTLTAVALLNPLETWHLFVELAHQMLELVEQGLHLVFEYMEMGLDHIIEHLFHTEMHATQVIVFYILVSFVLVALYLIGRRLPDAWSRLVNRQLLFWSRKKSSMEYFWGQQTPLEKLQIIAIAVSAIAVYGYFII